jgi:gliding motility-associated-like protein
MRLIFTKLFIAVSFFYCSNLGVFAQCGPLNTPQVTNNGQDGIMFDVVGLQSVNILQLGMDFDSGLNNTVRIYKKTGTHVGFTNNAAAWTLVGQVTGWASTSGQNVLIPIPINHFLCPGQVVSFYVTNTITANCNYSNGTGVGNTAAQDANIRVLQGTGKDYPFGTNFTPRVPNVRVVYNCATSCCLPPTMTSTPTSCVGACNGTATATVGAGGVGPYTYSWNTIPAQTTQTAVNLCAGTYTVSVTDATGCVATGTVTVASGNAIANSTITPAGPFCVLSPPVNLTAASPGGTWAGNGITNATTGSFNPSIAGAGTHSVTYTIPGACGSNSTTNIVVNPVANAAINAVGPFCDIDAPVILTAASAGGTWSGNGITNTATGLFDPVSAGAGTHTITYTIPGLCGDVETTTILVNPTYDATITPAGPFCASDAPVDLSGADPNGLWSGAGITNAVNGTFSPSVAGPGTHTISYVIAGACGDSAAVDILVNALDDATITPVGPLCFGSPVVTLVGVTPGGTWSGPGIVSSSLGTFNTVNAGAGIHTITYTTNGPCPDTDTETIEVLQPLQVQAVGDNTICEGESTGISATGSGGTGNYTFSWEDATGNVVAVGSNTNVSPVSTTVYTVTLSDGCSAPEPTDQVTINVNPLPIVSINSNVNEGCIPLSVTFTGPFSSNATCSWNFGNGDVSSACGSDSTVYNQAGCYDVSLTITENGCTSNLTLDDFICVGEAPVANFIFTPEVGDMFNTEFTFVNISTNVDTYLWNFDDGAGSNDPNPVHVFAEDPAAYNVCLIGSNEFGCSDTSCLGVQILETLVYYVPNSFTPDGNEYNQLFQPAFTSGFDPFNFYFVIYNRWGEVVWETKDPKSGWDGTGPNGKTVMDGTYIWRVQFKSRENGERMVDSGYVNVIR